MTNTIKTAVITGGNKGIGLALSRAFIEAGYLVYIGARENNGVADSLGKNATFLKTDVRNETDHCQLVNKVLDEQGKLDVYINNAGISGWKSIIEMGDEFMDLLIETNLKSVLWGCKAAAGSMQAGSSIINISSIAGKRGSANNSMYCATKFAVNGITQSLAKELGAREIRVNAICPVLIHTPGLMAALNETEAPGAGNPEQFIENFRKEHTALGRLPTAEEVGDMAVYLASDKASAITGQCINLDCGVFPQ